MNKKLSIILFVVFGFFAALISFFCTQLYYFETFAHKEIVGTPWQTYVPSFFPGFFFGVAISLATFLTKHRIPLKKVLLFILIATLSSFIDLLLQDFFFKNTTLPFLLADFIANVTATYIMLCGFHFFFASFSKRQFIVLGLLGGVLIIMPYSDTLKLIPLLFLINPPVMAGLLGWKLTIAQKKVA